MTPDSIGPCFRSGAEERALASPAAQRAPPTPPQEEWP
jgi:hypothetical protein